MVRTQESDAWFGCLSSQLLPEGRKDTKRRAELKPREKFTHSQVPG